MKVATEVEVGSPALSNGPTGLSVDFVKSFDAAGDWKTGMGFFEGGERIGLVLGTDIGLVLGTDIGFLVELLFGFGPDATGALVIGLEVGDRAEG